MTAVVVLLCLAGLVLLLLLVSLVRTLFIPSRRSEYVPAPDPARTAEYAEKLARMVRVETVSVPGENQREKFLAFHRELESLFPLVHQKLEKTEIDGNLLFFWKGKSAAKPLVLMSHQDVVPAEGEWTHAPFPGILKAARSGAAVPRIPSAPLWPSSKPWKNCSLPGMSRKTTCIFLPPAQRNGPATAARSLLRS